MIIFREIKKVNIVDYIEMLERFLFSLSSTLSKISGIPPILVEANQTQDDIEREFKKYIDKAKAAYDVYEDKILAKIRLLDNMLIRGQLEGKGLDVDKTNEVFKKMNLYIEEIQAEKDSLSGVLNNIINLFNKLIDDFNKTIEVYPKSPKDKPVKKLKKLK